ncbi:hypothetical protein Naga_100008g71 [Nannochloropsis gaditana]|uniref:Uncharacterized protein n=1 Tax=Nannochloropsis gaditana TaxID=72520 RepID=W7TWY7_9STRA|nr:hypothetical protein Naga_100008g71 [Nannochloropsis gaditana]
MGGSSGLQSLRPPSHFHPLVVPAFVPDRSSYLVAFSSYRCLLKRHSALSGRWPKSRSRTAPSLTGLGFAQGTQSDTMPRGATGAVRSWESKPGLNVLHKEREGRNERLQEEQGHQGLRARKRLRCQGWQCKGSGLNTGSVINLRVIWPIWSPVRCCLPGNVFSGDWRERRISPRRFDREKLAIIYVYAALNFGSDAFPSCHCLPMPFAHTRRPTIIVQKEDTGLYVPVVGAFPP